MAEGMLRQLLEEKRLHKFEVISAGTAAAAGFPATLYAIEAAKNWDVDISKHLSQPLSKSLIDKADLILAMTSKHYNEILRLRKDAKSKTYLFKNFPHTGAEGEDISDPIGQSLEKYNETFLEIRDYLTNNLDEIVKRIDEKATNE